MATKRRRGLPSVVLAGRPNVGKSTLFNRITRSRKAIVTRTPGTTRDLVAQDAEWRGISFRLVDSGGMFGASDDPLELKVLERGQLGIDSADLIVFVVDGLEGLVPPDREVADRVRKVGVPVILAVNKIDHRKCQRSTEQARGTFWMPWSDYFKTNTRHGASLTVHRLRQPANSGKQQWRSSVDRMLENPH